MFVVFPRDSALSERDISVFSGRVVFQVVVLFHSPCNPLVWKIKVEVVEDVGVARFAKQVESMSLLVLVFLHLFITLDIPWQKGIRCDFRAIVVRS